MEDIGDVISITVDEVNKLKEEESEIEAILTFNSRLPEPIDCKSVSISLGKEDASKNERIPGRRLIIFLNF